MEELNCILFSLPEDALEKSVCILIFLSFFFKAFVPHRILNFSICSAPSSPGAGRTPATRTVNIPVLSQLLNSERNGDCSHQILPGKGLCTGGKGIKTHKNKTI